MWKKVTKYTLNWHHTRRSGCIELTLDGGSEGVIEHLSCLDLDALGNILRNETSVWYHTTRGDLSTANRPSDEEERN